MIYYTAGYVARWCVLKTNCELLACAPGEQREKSVVLSLAEFVRLKEKGGLLYPLAVLYRFVLNMENALPNVLVSLNYTARASVTFCAW